MDAHKVLEWEVWEMRVTAEGVVTIGSEGIGSGYYAGMLSQYAPDNTQLLPGFLLAATSERAGSGPINLTRSDYFFQCDDLGINETYNVAATFMSNMTTYIEIDDFRVYAYSNKWQVQGSAIRWYTETTLRYTHPSFSLDGASNLMMPSAIPLIGIPPKAAPAGYIGIAIPV